MLPKDLSKHTCLMLVGLPGSGKSTTISMAPQWSDWVSGVPVVSTDKYIEQFAKDNSLNYKTAYYKYSSDAEKKMKLELAGLIKDKKTFIWDQTNLTVKTRKKKITYLKQHKYEIICLYFDLSIEEYNKRLGKRNGENFKVMNEKVISEMRNSYILPNFEEGFSKIFKASDTNIVELTQDLKKNKTIG